MAKDLDSVLKSLKIDAKMHRSSSIVPVSIPSVVEIEKLFGKNVHQPEGSVHEYKRGEEVITTVRFTCDPRSLNKLPIAAKGLCSYVTDINWTAGVGWPIYHSYCPRKDFVQDMRYPSAYAHQIVPVFGGYYWVGCNNPGCGVGNQETPVYFAVNDDKYDDNRGYFVVEITNYF